MAIQSVNPTNNQIEAEFEPHSSAYVESALERTEQAFKSWSAESFAYRGKLFIQLASQLRSQKEDLARLMTLEMGKTINEGIAEIEKCAWVCEYYAENAERFLKDEPLTTDSGKAFISYEPIGCVLAVMPWNFPFWQVFRYAAPTLMAGNTGILKHASNVPQCALAIEQLFIEAGFPVGVFQNLLIESSGVEALIDDRRIVAVTLTGSEPAGAKVAEAAGRNIKSSLLELGGSDPFIVLADADIDKTCRIAAKARMINCGQSCIAAKRFIVVERVYEEFIHKFTAFMKTYIPADPLQKSTNCGPMASLSLAEELQRQVSESVKAGAHIELGGKMAGNQGAFFEPTILTGVKEGMPAFEEEMFGPVASVIKAKDTDHAVAIANNSRFGLGGSVWTADPKMGLEVARKVQTGAMFVNQMVASDPRLPFGGIKKSGYGRELSHLGIREFVNQKTIVLP
ncbi:NAD-dependent succinate-semialdehyde dehydrogenase [Roseivirga thermotolerans]|uniref:Succinate-semialdehyde dehydrogenase n=1 Tax=Roseivirga thermotolerans TaxID=1758176 RepID=A0ABQ3I5S0_9BACT|nr:NAD-dependent succinate-semialdehyde dehydrogenase [Roseivirga thermotolerans]GHE60731.1 succinate-semialdehyde dehydrogenase [Roseivirga thermotolerans]